MTLHDGLRMMLNRSWTIWVAALWCYAILVNATDHGVAGQTGAYFITGVAFGVTFLYLAKSELIDQEEQNERV